MARKPTDSVCSRFVAFISAKLRVMDRLWPAEPPVLTDGRLRLRLWESADVPAVFDACQDLDIQRWTGIPSPYERQHAETFVDDLVPTQWAYETGAHFAVVNLEGALVGACGLNASEDTPGCAELGYWTVRAFRGQAVAVRATRMLAEWALTDAGFTQLELFVHVGNEASSRVAVKAGFTFDRLIAGKTMRDGTARDVLRYTRRV